MTAEEKEEGEEVLVVVVVMVVVVKVVVQSEGRGGNDGNAVTQGFRGRGEVVREESETTSEREKGRKEQREKERKAYVCGRGKVRERKREGRIKRLGRR